jgi:hypothetical protein
MSGPRLRLGDLFDDPTIGATKFFENHCAHRATPRKALQFRLNVERHLERDRKLRIAAAISSQWRIVGEAAGVEEAHVSVGLPVAASNAQQGAITAAHQG